MYTFIIRQSLPCFFFFTENTCTYCTFTLLQNFLQVIKKLKNTPNTLCMGIPANFFSRTVHCHTWAQEHSIALLELYCTSSGWFSCCWCKSFCITCISLSFYQIYFSCRGLGKLSMDAKNPPAQVTRLFLQPTVTCLVLRQCLHEGMDGRSVETQVSLWPLTSLTGFVKTPGCLLSSCSVPSS